MKLTCFWRTSFLWCGSRKLTSSLFATDAPSPLRTVRNHKPLGSLKGVGPTTASVAQSSFSSIQPNSIAHGQAITMNLPEFIYFDLGNVLLYFSRERQFCQMADALGISAAEVDQIVAKNDLMHRCETGQLSPEQAHTILCDTAESNCDFLSLFRAGSNIFELNLSMLPLITQLVRNGYRLGILSNTSANHWEYCLDHFSILRDCFEKIVLSYEVGVMKPQEEIYEAAIQAAGVSAGNIFYADDLHPNIEGANRCGMDAVLYTDTPSLVESMRQRGIELAL